MTRMTSTRRFNASFPAVSHALADELLGMLGFRHFLNMQLWVSRGMSRRGA